LPPVDKIAGDDSIVFTESAHLLCDFRACCCELCVVGNLPIDIETRATPSNRLNETTLRTFVIVRHLKRSPSSAWPPRDIAGVLVVVLLAEYFPTL
jgi:hypothetical protein